MRLVIVPTYDERENLGRIVPAILSQADDLHVLVVDDGSPDGTGEIADELAQADPRVHVLHRARKEGLGPAYVAGMGYALQRTDARAIVQMDADFSHDPASIPDLLEALEDADVVVGSRYRGGIRVTNWPLSRLVISVTANLYAAIVTGIPIRDLTAGFKAYRREALERIPLDRIRSDGYAFQIEMVYYAVREGLRVREVPIVFSDRVDGTSKLSRWIVFEAAWMVWWLRLSAPKRGRAAFDRTDRREDATIEKRPGPGQDPGRR